MVKSAMYNSTCYTNSWFVDLDWTIESTDKAFDIWFIATQSRMLINLNNSTNSSFVQEAARGWLFTYCDGSSLVSFRYSFLGFLFRA